MGTFIISFENGGISQQWDPQIEGKKGAGWEGTREWKKVVLPNGESFSFKPLSGSGINYAGNGIAVSVKIDWDGRISSMDSKGRAPFGITLSSTGSGKVFERRWGSAFINEELTGPPGTLGFQKARVIFNELWTIRHCSEEVRKEVEKIRDKVHLLLE